MKRSAAESMASQQREISISEFFAKNRHLLGFDNRQKALLTVVKEAVDNALDACEEAKILPELNVVIEKRGGDRLFISVQDNGPGIVHEQIPYIFGKLLYGSKFHRLRQSRGQQGIGISAAGLYAQITTGSAVSVVSSTGEGWASKMQVQINQKYNVPEVVKDGLVQWEGTGTRVSMEIEGVYRSGRKSDTKESEEEQ